MSAIVILARDAVQSEYADMFGHRLSSEHASRIVRRLLEAIHEPTEAMMQAPQKAGAFVLTMEGQQPLYPGNARQAWRLMIDAALEK